MSQRKYSSLNPVTDSWLAANGKTAVVSFHLRCFKQKGVGLLLFWSCSAFVLGNYAVRKLIIEDPNTNKVRFSLTVLGVVVFFLCAWFLVDVYIGRYRVIKACMLLMLLGTVLYSLSLSLKPFFPGGPAHIVVNQVITLMICFGLGGFQANIVQFSIDQLRDSSTTEILSFICFYVWTFFVGEAVATLLLSCVCERDEAIASLVFPVLLSLAVSSDFLFSHWVAKEVVSHNPLKLIIQILHYAGKNRYPSNRSTFAYWDDRSNSRLDLAAEEYGGPFTKEQVEDVKKFFQILSILFVSCFLIGMLLIDSTVFHVSVPFNFQGISRDGNCSTMDVYRLQCFRKFLLEIGNIAVVVFIPVWEILIFPMFWKVLLRSKMLTRHTVSMGVLFAYVMSLVLIEGIGEHNWREMNPNGTHTCPISSVAGPKYFGIPYAWLVIPSVLINLGVSMATIAGLEFVFAQSPYSMRGLVVNAVYLMLGMAVLAFYGLQLLFHLPAFNGLGDLGCVFWCLLACGVVAVLLIVIFLLACSRYRNRQRDHTSSVHSQEYSIRYS
jgi:peptide/histidine transporter 3/4